MLWQWVLTLPPFWDVVPGHLTHWYQTMWHVPDNNTISIILLTLCHFCITYALHPLTFWMHSDRNVLSEETRFLSVLDKIWVLHWWMIQTEENQSTDRKACPGTTLSTTKWTGTGLNPGLQGNRPATNCYWPPQPWYGQSSPAWPHGTTEGNPLHVMHYHLGTRIQPNFEHSSPGLVIIIAKMK